MLTLIACTALVALSSLQDRRVAVLPDGVEAGFIAFSSDGSFAAYCVREGESFRLVVGDWRSRPSPGPIFPVLSKHGSAVFYAINTERNVFRIFDRDRALFDLRMDAWGVREDLDFISLLSVGHKVTLTTRRRLSQGCCSSDSRSSLELTKTY